VLLSTTSDEEGQWAARGLPKGVGVAMRLSGQPLADGEWEVAPVGSAVPGRDGRSRVYPSNHSSAFFKLPLGGPLDTVLFRAVSLDALAFEDMDGDGAYHPAPDGPDAPLAGVRVALLAARSPLTPTGDTALTDDGGLVSFGGLVPGRYGVRFDPPAGYRVSRPGEGDHHIVRGDTGATDAVALASGERARLRLLGGLYRPATLTVSIFTDRDGTGIRAPGEPPATETTQVNLVVRAGDRVVSRQPMPASGEVTLSGLVPGEYRVSFDLVDCGGCRLQPQRGRTANGAGWSVGAADGSPLALLLRSGGAGTVEQGVSEPCVVQGAIFEDANGDGRWDREREPRLLAGVEVLLLDAETKRVVDSVVTVDGTYHFDRFAFGAYSVRVVPPEHYRVSPGRGAPPPLDETTDCARLPAGEEEEGVEEGGGISPTSSALNSAGLTDTFVCESSAHLVRNAGLSRPAHLRVWAWDDKLADGVYDAAAGDSGATGVRVLLTLATDTTFRRECTTAQGICTFGDLEAGSYVVESSSLNDTACHPPSCQQVSGFTVDVPNVWRDEDATPAGLRVLLAQRARVPVERLDVSRVHARGGGVVAVDVIVVPLAAGTGTAASLAAALGVAPSARWTRSPCVSPSLPSGAISARRTVVDLTSGDVVTVGYATCELASVGGFVFVDSNANGIWDDEEEPEPSSPVELRRRATDEIVDTLRTAASGRFDFLNVHPGHEYYLHFTECENCRFSPQPMQQQ
jgi:hypothetical protein